MVSDELQGTVLEHADRLREYRQIKEKMAMLFDARGQLKDPNAMDIGYSGEEDWTLETELGDFDVGAVGRSDHCYHCGGMEHIANECPTPKGKVKGKEDRSFYAKGTKGHEKGKGKSAGGKGHDKGKGQRCALTLGSVAMTLRDAGRSILNSFLGNPPMLSKRTTTISVITLTTTA